MTATWPCVVCGAQHSRRTKTRHRLKSCSEDCFRKLMRCVAAAGNAARLAARPPRPKRPVLPEGRTCAAPNCNNLIARREGERPCDYKHRATCDATCASALIHGRNPSRLIAESDPGMSEDAAESYLARIPPRLLPRLDELPAAERRKALEGWRAGA